MANVKDTAMTNVKNRFVGDMPKIGIRPTIDGRRKGVRESLEDQTMALAKSVASQGQRLVREEYSRRKNAEAMVELFYEATGKR